MYVNYIKLCDSTYGYPVVVVVVVVLYDMCVRMGMSMHMYTHAWRHFRTSIATPAESRVKIVMQLTLQTILRLGWVPEKYWDFNIHDMGKLPTSCYGSLSINTDKDTRHQGTSILLLSW